MNAYRAYDVIEEESTCDYHQLLRWLCTHTAHMT